MKSLAAQKAINVIKMEAWTHPADFRYQDETSEYKISCDRVAAQKLGKVYVPKPWEGLPYLTKDDLGKVYVRGFLHDGVAKNPDGTFCHPGTLSTTELLHRLSRAWKAHSRKHSETQISHQRLVFSLSREFHDAIVQFGRNPAMVLRGAVERTVRAFQEKFYPGDSVGYSYGLHHDTDNLQAHVFFQLHPNRKARSRSGCHRLSLIAEGLIVAGRLWSAFRKGVATVTVGALGSVERKWIEVMLLAPRLRLRNHWPRIEGKAPCTRQIPAKARLPVDAIRRAAGRSSRCRPFARQQMSADGEDDNIRAKGAVGGPATLPRDPFCDANERVTRHRADGIGFALRLLNTVKFGRRTVQPRVLRIAEGLHHLRSPFLII